MERAHKSVAGLSDERVEHRRRLSVDNLLYDVIYRGLAKLQETLSENATAGVRHDFANDPVGFPGPDIVGADAEHVAGDVIQHMPYQRHDVLVGRSPHIDNVVAAFESFISCRMPEQTLGALDNRNNLLARGRCVAADDVVDLFVADQFMARRMISGN